MSPILIGRSPFFSEVDLLLKAALKSTSVDASQIPAISVPPDFRFGQATLPTHSFAKVLRQAPAKIAEGLASEIMRSERRFVAKVEAVNGYLNFTCDFTQYAVALFAQIESGDLARPPLLPAERTEKILVEYAQPNTHKALHVGHLRNVVYGDAVCALLKAVGHQVVRATYPGDMGAHIAKMLWYIQNFKQDQIVQGDADWLGQMYAESADYVSSHEDPIAANQIKRGISEVLHQLQSRSGAYYDLYMRTREWSLHQMRDVYDWLGVHFDQWFFESECDEPSRELVLQKYNEGFFIKSEGAIGKDLTEYNLGFAMFLKSDGTGLYLTKDLELIRRKFLDPEVTSSIVVVDARQRLHFQQLFKTAELLGYPQAAKSLHLSYESVTTEDGKAFSSRSRNGLALGELRQQMEAKVRDDYLNQYKGEWAQAEIDATAQKVALGALKYGMLSVDSNSQIRFVLEEWLRLDGETGPYLQYCYARCGRILEKVGAASHVEHYRLEHPLEGEVLSFLGRYPQFLVAAASDHQPAVLTGYLFDLCKLFNRFYKECSVKDAADIALRQSRLALVHNTREVLGWGLDVLGIPRVERM